MKRILVIDDEDSIRRALRTVLERAGYRIPEARSGDALRLWYEEESDLVITDIHMAGMSGVETILQLRALSPHLPIIAVSGSGTSTCRDLLDGAGVSEPIRTLDKPFKIAEMLECVSEALQTGERQEGSAYVSESFPCAEPPAPEPHGCRKAEPLTQCPGRPQIPRSASLTSRTPN
jgi:CheY-like chemotaxis protein